MEQKSLNLSNPHGTIVVLYIRDYTGITITYFVNNFDLYCAKNQIKIPGKNV